MKGRIVKINIDRGFGFIDTGQREQFYFSLRSVSDPGITVGTAVEFEIRTQRDGRKRADRIRVIREVPTAGTEGNLFYNPYNFARWLTNKNQGFFAREKPVSHEFYNGYTGYLKCTLKVETPLFISDGNPETTNQHSSFDFYKIDGQPVVPGSSLRGMLRSVYEVVTNSCFNILTDGILSRRMEAKEGRDLVPARVLYENEQWKLQLFRGRPQKCEKPLQAAGWIRRYERLNGKPVQRPIVEIGDFQPGDEAWAVMVLTEPMRSRVAFWDVRGLFNTREEANQWSSQLNEKCIIERGRVYTSYQNIENKHDERFFFGNVKVIDLPEEVRKDYRLVVNDYKDRHQEDLADEKAKRKLPQGKIPALSRFMWEDTDLQHGALVYACIKNNHLKYVIPVQISRRPYGNSIGELLPEYLRPCEEYAQLCPACRLFGWVKTRMEGAEETQPLLNGAYAGRIQVSMGRLTKDNGTTDGIPLAELAGPKPTTTFFYLTKKDISGGFVGKREGYNSTYQTLRGRKLYRHHHQFEWKTGEKTKRNRTINGVVNPKSEFSFTVKFHNLSPEELGALAWSLKLEEGMYHRLGYGKSLGLGSVSISIDCCKVYEMAQRYTDPVKTGEKDIEVNDYIQCFKDACKEAYGKEFLSLENIVDLKTILSKTQEEFPIQYPRPIKDENDPVDGEENFEWFKSAASFSQALPLAHKDNGLPFYRKGEGANNRRPHR